MTRLRLAAGAAAALTLLSGCGGGHAARPGHATIAVLPATVVPPQLAGLRVVAEPLAPLLQGVSASDATAAGFYSLRAGRQLEATLQLTKFGPTVSWRSRSLQQRVVNQIGEAQPRVVALPDGDVYVSAGGHDRLAVWFRSGYLFVLTIRNDYAYPRTLVRIARGVAA